MRYRLLVGCASVMTFALMSGCSTAQYTGMTPTARAFTEDPSMRQVYVGATLDFTLDPQPPHTLGAPHEWTPPIVVDDAAPAGNTAVTSIAGSESR